MRLLVVCESPPTLDPRAGNGSTLIPARLLPRLPTDVEVDLLWFHDRDARPDRAVLDRCRTARRLDVRPELTALAAQPLTRLPRATWQRAGADPVVVDASRHADVVYLHGLHTFSPAAALTAPVVVHEVDPWSHNWERRAAASRGAKAAYERLQAARARQLERRVGAVAARYVVVNPEDARRLAGELGRAVDALPNGVDLPQLAPRDPSAVDPDLLVFVGTLDYPPNVAAVTELCTQVLPRVLAERPQTRLVVAGRRPVPAVAALTGEGVQVVGEVDDVRDVFARAAAAVYPGALGRGTKNTVLEALAVGCPVVASPEAARGAPTGQHLALGADPAALARQALALLRDPAARDSAGASAARAVRQLPDWDAVAEAWARLLRDAASHVGVGAQPPS